MENGVKSPDLASLKRMFEDAANLTSTARVQSQTDRDYYDGIQWTREEKEALRARKQPDNVFNRVRPAVNGTVGVIDQGQTDPRAWPRNPGDEDAAEVASKVLRYIEDRNRFDRTKIECAMSYFIEGTAAVITEVNERQDIEATVIRFEEFFYDPRSRRRDFKDARYLGVAKWRYADEVTKDPDKAKAVDAVIELGMGDQTFEDRPSDGSTNVSWVDAKKRRVMVVELYHKEGGDWYRCLFHAGGVLEYGKSEYLDTYKQTKCPIEAVSCYVDRENNRYGIVRDMRGPQDEINKRRSKLLHLLSVSQIQAIDPSAVEVDANAARSEAARPDGVIPFGWQKVTTADMAAGQANLLTEAKAEIERMGPNPAILGRQGESSSGRAQLVRQQAGLTELSPALGEFDDFVLRIYRAWWEAARQFWKAPMFIRVSEDNGAPEFVGINQPKSVPITDPLSGQPIMGPQGPVMRPDPALGYENALAEMDVDITIETTPDTANIAQEQFMALVDLAKAGVQIPPQILIESSSLPKKREIVEKMQELAQQPNPQAEMQQEGMKAQIQETQSKVKLNEAKALQTVTDAHLGAFQAGQQSVPAAGDTGAQAA